MNLEVLALAAFYKIAASMLNITLRPWDELPEGFTLLDPYTMIWDKGVKFTIDTDLMSIVIKHIGTGASG